MTNICGPLATLRVLLAAGLGVAIVDATCASSECSAGTEAFGQDQTQGSLMLQARMGMLSTDLGSERQEAELLDELQSQEDDRLWNLENGEFDLQQAGELRSRGFGNSTVSFAEATTGCPGWCFGDPPSWPRRCNWRKCKNCAYCTAIEAPAAAGASMYVPGQPGASWSEEEVLVVRAKLHAVISNGGDAWNQLGRSDEPTEMWSSVPSAAKILRLGFHDCFKYADGSGGCDGCLEWHGVGHRFPRDTLGLGRYPQSQLAEGQNNGLGPTVQVLEGIYSNGNFPARTPSLQPSLQQRGKSRADLWALATLVAVEYSIDLNNRVCANKAAFESRPYKQCHPRDGEPDCRVEAPRPFAFKTGRSDCVPADEAVPYATDKHEVHPDATTNGLGTLEFFKENFGFGGRETVAIMGAHTLGRMSVTHSLFRYTWKAKSQQLFNNGYYRNLALRRDWYYPTGVEHFCKRVGNHRSERPEARWLAHVRGDVDTGGPVQWIQFKKVCRNYNPASADLEGCEEEDLEWKFVMGLDETALPCELGLYYDFEVGADGIPTGCPGFAKFNMEHWGKRSDGGLQQYSNTWTKINGTKAAPQCPMQRHTDATGEKPLHEIVEEFADSTSSWLEVFTPTLEKMLENGYAPNELQEAPAGAMTDFSCRFHGPYDHDRFWSCAKTGGGGGTAGA